MYKQNDSTTQVSKHFIVQPNRGDDGQSIFSEKNKLMVKMIDEIESTSQQAEQISATKTGERKDLKERKRTRWFVRLSSLHGLLSKLLLVLELGSLRMCDLLLGHTVLLARGLEFFLHAAFLLLDIICGVRTDTMTSGR